MDRLVQNSGICTIDIVSHGAMGSFRNQQNFQFQNFKQKMIRFVCKSFTFLHTAKELPNTFPYLQLMIFLKAELERRSGGNMTFVDV